MIDKEPTVIIGGLAEIARAIVPLLIIFGYINWTDNQVAQVMLVIGVVVGVAEKWFTRSQTVPTIVANEQIEQGINSPKGTSVKDVIAATKGDG